MVVDFLLLASMATGSPVTLAEAKSMTPSALAARLLPNREPRPIVDAIINGRGGLTPPSESLNRVWLIEQMEPFDATTCRSHAYVLEMEPVDRGVDPWIEAVATRPKTTQETNRLWAPSSGAATAATCAAAPAGASGFYDGGFGLKRASDLVGQARTAFRSSQRFTVDCTGERGACGSDPRKTLAALAWSELGALEQVSAKGEPYSVGDPKPADAAWGPEYLRFTFPYAASGATWVITVHRAPHIKSVSMEARTIIYE